MSPTIRDVLPHVLDTGLPLERPVTQQEGRHMHGPRWIIASALPAAIALAVTGCGSGDGDSSSGAADTQAAITVYNTEPENPLVPGNTTEVGGSRVLDAMFTGLVEYDPDTAQPVNAMAESIEDVNKQKYTIKIKKGWKFHDGTEVKAKNFVDAWNWTAYAPNATQGASFFEQVQGYEDVHPEAPEGADAPKPKSEKMSGLKVLDDYTFEVTFAEPFSVFPTQVGYEVYSPMPDSFFKNPKAFEDKPIGNGPFEFVSRKVNSEIKMTRNEAYPGKDKPKFKDLTWKIYETPEAAYSDLVDGNLDFMQELPPNALAGKAYESDLGERAIIRESLMNQALSFPYYTKPYDNVDLHKAVSMAIDRKEIADTIFEGTRAPADGFVHPKIKGYKKNQCGEFCQFNPKKAKDFLKKSGFKGPLKLRSNTDGGHREWAEAVCNQVKNNLGIQCQFVPVTTFAEHRQKVNDHTMDAPYRAGWVADYPHIENWLNPQYRTGGSSNDGLYSNKAVDAKLAEADRATTDEQAIALYQEAERMVAQDMASIPLWTQKTVAGKSERMKVANLDPYRDLDLASVEVTS